MALNEYISEYSSTLSSGRREVFNTLLERAKSGDFPISIQDLENILTDTENPITQLSNNLTSINGYNNALTTILGDLGSLYSQSNNLWKSFDKLKRLNKEDVQKLKLAIDDLESRINNSIQTADPRTTYTDLIVESFNVQTPIENNLEFYQNNTIQKAYIDNNDGLLKLPIDGDFSENLTTPGVIPSNVFLDRLVGMPVSEGNEVNKAFDNTDVSFWNETIHSSNPIYASNNQFPWLPNTYAGGAACRIKIEFEKSTRISELDIRPYSTHSINLLAIGYVDETQNLLADPTFYDGLNPIPNIYWYYNTTSFGSTGTGSATILDNYGPDGENIVYMFTNSATGSIFIQHGAMQISNSGQGIETSFVVKTVGNTKIQVGITYISSGTTIIDDKIETISLDSLGWTKVIMSFDPPPATTYIKFRIGIPPLFDRKAELWFGSPRIDTIRQIPYYEKIDTRKTIFIKNSIEAKRLYLVFSQENYEFKHYSINEIDFTGESRWERLTRRININPQILSWDKDINRGSSITYPKFDVGENSFIINYLRSNQSVSWQLLNNIEKYAYPNTNQQSFPTYEYQIGAYEIYIRHREYAPRGRFVSKPIKVSGEIRDVKLKAIDGTNGSEEIVYSITLNEEDTPDKAKIIANSNTVKQDISSYPTPSGEIAILPYTTWTSNSSGTFIPYAWPSTPNYDLVRNKVLLVKMIGSNATSKLDNGNRIVRTLSTPLDLRGAAALTAKFYLWSEKIERTGSYPKFVFGISQDGNTWIEEEFTASFMDHYNQGANGFSIFNDIFLNLTEYPTNQKNNITYIKIEAKSPTYYLANTWLEFMNLKAIGTFNGGTTTTFVSTEDLSNLTTNSFIAPVRKIVENIGGTDRYGRIFLKNYPHISRSRIRDLVSTVSTNLNGITVDFDPNALNPKYLNNSGDISYTTGYRPILATLYFPNTKITAYPDTLGKPSPGDIAQSIDEVLTQATMSQTSSSQSTTINSSTSLKKTFLQTANITRNFTIYQTRFRDLVVGINGSPISCSWRKSTTLATSGIDSARIRVDTQQGLIQILELPPNGYDQLIATYYYVVGENSAREYFNIPGITNYGLGATIPINTQNYPITRNVTDYMRGEIPILKPPILDTLDPEYYPVYEYYVHPDGYLVFAENMHTYSDTPAQVKIEYDSLAITPRIIIDLYRPNQTNLTPWIDSYQLLLNIARY